MRQVHFMYMSKHGADAKPLDGVFIDRNKDGIEQDKYRFHKPAADVFYGFNTSLNIKTLIWNELERFLG
jgi:iron complex outermembrane receptor protein